MRNVFMTAIAAMAISTAAFAEETTTATVSPELLVTGGVGVDFTENTAGNVEAESTVEFGLDVNAFGSFATFGLEVVDGGDVTLDSWKVGTELGFGTVSYGDQGDLFVGNDFEVVGGDTIADPAEFDSLMVTVGDAAVMVALTDATSDVTDVESVQGSYGLDMGAMTLTAVGDYNIDSEDYILGGKASMDVNDIALGGIVTYGSANETVGYEASVGYSMVTAFVNGDDTDTLQNVGAGVNHTVNGLNIYAEGSYNVDSEEFTPAAGVSFNF